jgi:hypothetical protein
MTQLKYFTFMLNVLLRVELFRSSTRRRHKVTERCRQRNILVATFQSLLIEMVASIISFNKHFRGGGALADT